MLDLLRRSGGIKAGAEPDDVYVVRSNITTGERPEVFHVDLGAIVLDNDHRTNIRVQPFDQIHVGETRHAEIERCLPPWMRPAYQFIWDTRPADRPHRSKLLEQGHGSKQLPDFVDWKSGPQDRNVLNTNPKR